MSGADTIDGYLDRLLVELRGRAHDVRRILAEAEEHLNDAAAEADAGGMAPAEAEAHATARFGAPRVVARRFAGVPTPGREAMVAELLRSVAWLAAVGFLAIGASGLVAIGMRAAWGAPFVAGDLPGVTYTGDRCADFEEYHPEAPTCAAAATAHHADEVETYRLAAGVLGLGVGVGWWMWTRRRATKVHAAVLPEGFTATAGAALFGVAGVILLVQSLGLLVDGTSHGAGQWLSGAMVSLAVAATFAWSLFGTIRSRATT